MGVFGSSQEHDLLVFKLPLSKSILVNHTTAEHCAGREFLAYLKQGKAIQSIIITRASELATVILRQNGSRSFIRCDENFAIGDLYCRDQELKIRDSSRCSERGAEIKKERGGVDLEGVSSLAAHELEGALQDGARVPERPPAASVGDGNVQQLGRRGRRLRHGWSGRGQIRTRRDGAGSKIGEGSTF
jgi:hypothetical protein